MFLIDNHKKRIFYYKDNELKDIVWDFEHIKKYISTKYASNDFSKENVFFNHFLLSKEIDYEKNLFIYDTKRKYKIIVNKHVFKTLWLIHLIKILFFLDSTVCLDFLQRIDIFWEFKIKYTKVIRIETNEDLLKIWLLIEWYKKTLNYYTCYTSFSYELWIYEEIDNFIENKTKWTDINKKIALEKAISESIERVSWCTNPQNIYKYEKEYTYFLPPYIDIDEFMSKKHNCNYVKIYNLVNKWNFIYCPIEIINYPCKAVLHSRIWNSNWMATHTTSLKAKENAVLEVIERDSFIMMWLLKTWIYKIDKKTLEKNILSLIKKIEKKHDLLLHVYVIKFDNIIPVSFIIASKNWKNIVGTGIGKTLWSSIEKGIQEILWMIGFFEKDINISSSKNIVIQHIIYYLDPSHYDNIKWLINLDSTDLDYVNNLFKNKYSFTTMLNYYKDIWIDFYFYRYNTILNKVFKRYTVRVLSNRLLPIYFWQTIPKQILASPRLDYWKKKQWIHTINSGLHPMW